MPKLEALARDKGIIYTKAFAPGPASPSSHSSFFTGELPSQTGMHEAHPFFNKDIKTIAKTLEETHTSLAISVNPFIFNGLCRNFDLTEEFCRNQYMIFNKARDPREHFFHGQFDNKIRKYFKFVSGNRRPFRSIINGLSYLIWYKTQGGFTPKTSSRDKRGYQYANTMNRMIREFPQLTDSDVLIVANYMDLHPPLDISDEALRRFLPDRNREELPIGIKGQEIRRKMKEQGKEMEKICYNLEKATIWDLDRKIASLIEYFLERGAFVVITADHGSWISQGKLEDRRIHVPLILFVPPYDSKVIHKTVNLRSLPRTTMEVVRGETGNYKGTNLLEVSSHQLSITEYIHNPNEKKSPVTPKASKEAKNQYDIVALKGDARLDLVENEYTYSKGSPEEIEELKAKIEELKAKGTLQPSEEVKYKKEIKQRLRDLGYLN